MNDISALLALLKDCLELMECELDKCPFNGYQRDEWDKLGRRCTCEHQCSERVAELVPRLRAVFEIPPKVREKRFKAGLAQNSRPSL